MTEVKLIAGIMIVLILGLFSIVIVDNFNQQQCRAMYVNSTRTADDIVKICGRNQ